MDVEDRVEQTSPGRSQAVPTDLHLSHIYCGLRPAGLQLDALTLCITDSNPDTTEALNEAPPSLRSPISRSAGEQPFPDSEAEDTNFVLLLRGRQLGLCSGEGRVRRMGWGGESISRIGREEMGK